MLYLSCCWNPHHAFSPPKFFITPPPFLQLATLSFVSAVLGRVYTNSLSFVSIGIMEKYGPILIYAIIVILVVRLIYVDNKRTRSEFNVPIVQAPPQSGSSSASSVDSEDKNLSLQLSWKSQLLATRILAMIEKKTGVRRARACVSVFVFVIVYENFRFV